MESPPHRHYHHHTPFRRPAIELQLILDGLATLGIGPAPVAAASCSRADRGSASSYAHERALTCVL
jgi:hypothetical protein